MLFASLEARKKASTFFLTKAYRCMFNASMHQVLAKVHKIVEFDFRRKYFEQFAYMFISYILWLDQ